MKKTLHLSCGIVFTALGIIGALVPVMPTTVFLIVALYCFSKSSPTLEHWLINHPRFGASLVDWRQNGAISKKVKCIACCSMLLSFAGLCLFASMPLLAYLAIAIFMGGSAYFVVTRPNACTR